MSPQKVFQILVLLYTVTNMASIGLELNLRETLKSLRSARLVLLTLLWGWVVGPAFAVLLTKVLPLAEPHALGLLIFSLAPVAPMLSILARKARSDMDFTAALIPLAMVATVVLLPLMAPWLMKGLTLNIWALAKPLLLLVLLPLVVCAALKVYAAPVAEKVSPVIKRLAGISTLLCLGFVVVFNFQDILRTVGSYAIGAEVLFLLAIAVVSYRIGFGLKQGQRSAMALAMATRNGAPMLAVFTAFAVQDPRMLVMFLRSGPVPAIVAFPLARFFASRPGKTSSAGAGGLPPCGERVETSTHGQ
jgi:bile acid:Na+ symporter, BASS family